MIPHGHRLVLVEDDGRHGARRVLDGCGGMELPLDTLYQASS